MQAKLKTIVVLSIFGIVMPFLGVPLMWRVWASALLAFIIAVLAYMLLAERRTGMTPESSTESEHTPFSETYPPQEQQTEGHDTYDEQR